MTDICSRPNWSARGAVAYGALILYVSLYPFCPWRSTKLPLFSFLIAPLPQQVSRSDLLSNVVAYVPFGILLYFSVRKRSGTVASFLSATLVGFALSMMVESTQMFLPSRTASNIDVGANVSGTLVGALAAVVLNSRTVAAAPLIWKMRAAWFGADGIHKSALVAAALWIGAQLSPFVPSMDVSSIRSGLSPLANAVGRPWSMSVAKIAEYALNLAALALLVAAVSNRGRRVSYSFLLLAGTVLCCKPFIITRQLAPEALFGFAGAVLLVTLVPVRRPLLAMVIACCILTAVTVSEIQSPGGSLHRFSWVPFAGQIEDNLNAFGNILEWLWTAMALVCCWMILVPRSRATGLIGCILLVACVGALEWHQQALPGRYGEITPMLLSAAGWAWGWWFADRFPATATLASTTRSSLPLPIDSADSSRSGGAIAGTIAGTNLEA